MPPLNRNDRPARLGRRFWNGHEVDLNLKDEWLERLNGLTNFRLTSICEGHVSERRGSGRNPHLILRLSGSHNPLLFSTWNNIRPKLYGRFPCNPSSNIFRVNFELTSHIRLSRGMLQPSVDKFLVRIAAINHRIHAEPEPWLADFFSQSVTFAETADRFIGELLAEQQATFITNGKYVSGTYLRFRYGMKCSAVLIDAVHAVKPKADAYTGKIVETVANNAGCHAIISTLSRKVADLNRPPTEENAGAVEEYRRTIRHLFETIALLKLDSILSRPILHLAIHGMKDRPDADIELSTRMGDSCSDDVLEWVRTEIEEWAQNTASLSKRPTIVVNRRFIGDQSKNNHRKGARQSSYDGYGEFFNTIQIEISFWLRKEHRVELVDLIGRLANKFHSDFLRDE